MYNLARAIALEVLYQRSQIRYKGNGMSRTWWFTLRASARLGD